MRKERVAGPARAVGGCRQAEEKDAREGGLQGLLFCGFVKMFCLAGLCMRTLPGIQD